MLTVDTIGRIRREHFLKGQGDHSDRPPVGRMSSLGQSQKSSMRAKFSGTPKAEIA
jgi:hypothetical protein